MPPAGRRAGTHSAPVAGSGRAAAAAEAARAAGAMEARARSREVRQGVLDLLPREVEALGEERHELVAAVIEAGVGVGPRLAQRLAELRRGTSSALANPRSGRPWWPGGLQRGANLAHANPAAVAFFVDTMAQAFTANA